jgi:hypothetical protein
MHIVRSVLSLAMAVVVLYGTGAYAYSERKDYFSRPQLGGWFGIITPMGDISNKVGTSLGGGIFGRLTFPYPYLKIGLDVSYQKFKQNDLQFVPAYANLLFQIPVDFPVRFQFKGGGGLGYIHLKPNNMGQWEPIFMGGFEISFPAGRMVNIGLRIDYIFIYEGYIKGSKAGAHVLNSAIQLYFNI